MTDKRFSFEIDKNAIQTLAKVLEDANLSEIEYEDQGRRVRLTRSISSTVVQTLPTSAVASQAPDSNLANTVVPSLGDVKSPMVGTLYLSPEPGAAAFVTAGARVNKGDTVCIIEAMKVMNPIKAHMSGTVKKVCFEDASPVEFGDTLLTIE